MRYGVANVTGLPNLETVTCIVSTVWNCGVRFFDTAQAYGTSETILGRAFSHLSRREEPRVITKLNANLQGADVNTILKSLESSLERLQLPQLWAVLLHSEDQLDHWNTGLATALIKAKRMRMTARIGISVYSPERALQALKMDELDLIQVPANIFDRRMQRAGVFERARQVKKSVFVRSVYLQGVALMCSDSVVDGIRRGNAAVKTLGQFCTKHGVNRQHFAIDYVRRMAPGARIIIGAETERQAVENCAWFQKKSLSKSLTEAWTRRWPEDIDGLVDPRKWRIAMPN
jgi:aryl-alcohol dehydrogenase-like predicted oxidoreductase